MTFNYHNRLLLFAPNLLFKKSKFLFHRLRLVPLKQKENKMIFQYRIRHQILLQRLMRIRYINYSFNVQLFEKTTSWSCTLYRKCLICKTRKFLFHRLRLVLMNYQTRRRRFHFRLTGTVRTHWQVPPQPLRIKLIDPFNPFGYKL